MHEFLNLPEERVFTGMALGYEDKSSPINQFKTERAKFDEFVKTHS